VDALRNQQTKAIADNANKKKLLGGVDFGRYYALVIGNNDYQSKDWEHLKTAVNDAKSIGQMLESKYGFKVNLLTNATRAQMVKALQEYVDELGPRDNLLIYYAGHGILDSNGTGYWVPVDGASYTPGKPVQAETMLRHEDLLGIVQRLQAKQVIVLADSCFSGALTTAIGTRNAMNDPKLVVADAGPALRTRGIKVHKAEDAVDQQLTGTVVTSDTDDELATLVHWASKPARFVLTSGGNEPVIDQVKATDNHSIFAKAVLNALGKNTSLMKGIELTVSVQDEVVRGVGTAVRGRGGSPASAQTPSSNYILGYNGEFLFVAR
jgi:hypothetical protein